MNKKTIYKADGSFRSDGHHVVKNWLGHYEHFFTVVLGTPTNYDVKPIWSKRYRSKNEDVVAPKRIDILRVLKSKSTQTYLDLKSLAGFKSKRDGGKFAYHLRRLLRQSLITLNKSGKRYEITNLGRVVLYIAEKQVEKS